MIIGIGTDILKISKLNEEYLQENDPFFRRTFTQEEAKQANLRPNRRAYLASRFAAKEAIYKAMNRSSEGFLLCDVEILNESTGKPRVALYRESRKRAVEQGISRIELSVSYEDDLVIAYAVSLSE